MRDFKPTRTPNISSRWMRTSCRFFGFLLLFGLGAVWTRAYLLQVRDQAKLKSMAQDQYVRFFEVPARRGDIFDRRGVALAQSVEVDSIWVDPTMLGNSQQSVQALAKATGVDFAELSARLSKGKRFVWVKRQATPAQVDAAKALKLPGLGLTKEPRRFYPQRELAAHVIGWVGNDGRGLDGLEHAFEAELSGQAQKLAGYRDARGRKLLTQGRADSSEWVGASVSLTLDRQLQYVVEKALTRAVGEAQAIAGMAVMLDPKTGEILALANYPRFNPNTPTKLEAADARNRAVMDAFEPGSTMKPFVVAAAFEEKRIRENESFNCENGNWVVGKHTIRDTHPYASLTPARILQVSSNICTGKIAQALGRENLVSYYQRFGFAQKAGLALPGEGRGVVPFPRAEVSLATQSFGQGMTVTAVQLASAYGALANGGVLMRPYLVSKVVDPDGLVLLENHPTQVRQVVSAPVAARVIQMLEGVVGSKGTAPLAKVEGFRVAGKTGTAQKADPVAKGYSDKRLASFVGVVPAEAPRVVIAVIIDEPKTDVYGGLVAAPAFREMAGVAMSYLGVAPSEPVAVPASLKEVASTAAQTSDVSAVKKTLLTVERDENEALTETSEEGSVRVPDLSGVVARKAIAKLLAVALEPRLSGSGRVVAQKPAPGAWVSKGSAVSLELAGGLPPETK